MPAQPVEKPKWADTVAPATPSAGRQNSGWLGFEIPTADTFNWLAKWTWRWIDWLDSWSTVDHDLDGHHDIVRVMTRLHVEQTASIAYQLGVGTPGERIVTIPMGGPAIDGWQTLTGAVGVQFTVNPGGAPPNVANTAGIQAFSFAKTIDLLVAGQDDSAAGDQWEIRSIEVRYRRNGAGDTWTLRLMSVATGVSVAPTVESTTALTVSAGVYATQTIALAVPVNPGRRYWIEAVMASDAASAAGEVAFSGARVTAARRHLE